MSRSLRLLAAYEVASGIVALVFNVHLTALAGGGAIVFNAFAASLCLVSVGAGLALWRGLARSWGASLLLQALQMVQLKVSHFAVWLMIGAELVVRLRGDELGVFTTAGLNARAWWYPTPQPFEVSVNLLAVAAFVWLRRSRPQTSGVTPNNELLQQTEASIRSARTFDNQKHPDDA